LLDIKWIRDNQDAFVKGLADRGADGAGEILTQILSLDEQRRATIQKLQEAQARRNAASKEIGQAKASKDEASAKRLMDEVAALKGTIQDGEPTFPSALTRRPMSSCEKSARRRNSGFSASSISSLARR
jgi:seryl-tRNA synthetase